jgi:uncharacterized protein (DUF2237 family)
VMNMRIRLRWAAVSLAVASAVVLVASLARDQTRCRDACYGPPPGDRYGSLTNEPGHHWTSYAGSWQWGVQSGLAHLAALAAFVGVVLAATTYRNPVPAFWVAGVALSGWIAWVLLSPPMT